MNEEIKEFVEFRIDEDGTYFYYNDKDNVEHWSYKLDDLKDYIINLQQKNARLKDKLTEIKKVIDGYMPNEHAMCKAFDEIEFIIKEN